MVRSPDGDTDFFKITNGVLQGDTLILHLFIISLHIARYSGVKITDSDYDADDLAVLSDYFTDATVL